LENVLSFPTHARGKPGPQTTLTALSWFYIVRAGFPAAPVLYRHVLAAYASGVALNGFLRANVGTVAMLLMFVANIPGANVAGVLGGAVVQKIFFTLAGAFVYAYLFLSAPGSFERQLGAPHDHPVLFLAILGGAVLLLVLLARVVWRRLKGLWERRGRVARSAPGPANTPCESRCPRSVHGSPRAKTLGRRSRPGGRAGRLARFLGCGNGEPLVRFHAERKQSRKT
jgi:hypothetical protein